jgi:hypothetical protein
VFSKSSLSNHLYGLRGKSVKEKFIIIESDDWGSIRMKNRKTYDTLLSKNYPVDQCAFNRNDALEANDDFSALFEVLRKHKGCDGKPVVLTANFIVGNPDFEKIEENSFLSYHWEPFTSTLERYPNRDQVYSLYQQGIKEGLFFPQYHGTEHVHVSNWMQALQNNDTVAREGFRHQMFSISSGLGSNCKKEFLDVFGLYHDTDAALLSDRIALGLRHFKQLWSYDSKTCIAPCYVWDDNVETILSNNGVKYIQSGRTQLSPDPGGTYVYKRRFGGQKNKLGQTYSVRNVFFEPSTDDQKDWISSAMKEIKTAFQWHTPAVISTHRVNFMGSISESNRSHGLALLDHLLTRVTKHWPDVKFIHSADLANHYS